MLWPGLNLILEMHLTALAMDDAQEKETLTVTSGYFLQIFYTDLIEKIRKLTNHRV